jgi:GAF domain-containing protein
MVKQFDAFHVWLALREQPSGPITYHSGKRRDGRKVELTDLQLQEKIIQSIERKQSSVMPRVSAQMQSKDRIRSALIAPIVRKSGCYGVLYVDNAMVHDHYSLSDLDYLMILAMHVAAILKGLLDI